MTVTSIRNRDFRSEDFSKEEVAAMERDASTSADMNKVRQDVGIKGPSVSLRGDDKSNAELKAEWEKADINDAIHSAVQDLIREGFAEVAAIQVLGPFVFAKDALQALERAEARGEALKANNERGSMHLALTTALDLPAGYKSLEIAKWKEAGTGNASGAMRMGTELDTKARAENARAQLHADRGMNAAQELIGSGTITRAGGHEQIAAALAADPKLKEKLDSDAAFRMGFDGLVWAKQHDTAQYDAALKNLNARDARYDQHHIVRG